MKLIYIAAPYTGTTWFDIAENIRAAERWGLVVAQTDGAWPLIPQSNTGQFFGSVGDDAAYEGTLEMMRRCDAVLVVGIVNRQGKPSVGVRLEIEEAERLDMPVLAARTEAEVKAWIANLPQKTQGGGDHSPDDYDALCERLAIAEMDLDEARSKHEARKVAHQQSESRLAKLLEALELLITS